MKIEQSVRERSLKLSSQELVETNSQLRAIFEALPDLFFHIDHTGKIIDYKTGNRNGFNFSPELLLGKYIQETPIPEWREQFGAAFRQVQEKKSLVTIEYSAQLQAGTEFYEARLLPLLEDQVVAIIRNITRRKQAEQSLEKSLAKIKASLHEKEVLLKLVLSLTKQLKGRITHHHRNGAEFRIEFKPAEKNRRKLHA